MMVVMGYLGAVIGAGFASGQEIVQFFVEYGSCGLRGTILATLLFATSGGMLLYIAHRKKASNYQDILTHILGTRAGKIVDLLLALFLFLGISTMLSASGAVFYEHLYLPKTLGIFLAYALVIILLVTGKKGLIVSFNLLVPIKLLLLLLITGYAALFIDGNGIATYTTFLSPAETNYWFIASLLYVAYNFSLAMVVLAEYQTVTNAPNGIAGAAWGGVILGGLLVLTYLALSKFLPIVTHYEVPMLYVAGMISPQAKIIYTLVLWVGILTTAIANAYGFSQRFASFTGMSYSACLLICMTLALPVAMQSFSVLVGTVYPLFGFLGIIILGALIYKATKDMAVEMYYNIKKLIKGTREA
ncbi:MAG: hypothetical protein PHR65_02205 [Syntrophomonadaceae bacterium]|nr:hypothetical protein [Syntrophomonadaceae bacterium]